MTEDILVPSVMFLTIGTVLSLLLYFRYRTRREIQATVRAAIEHGQQLTPEVLEGLADASGTRHGDLRRGVVSLAVGIAFFAFGSLLGEPDAEGPLRALSVFPMLIGLAYLGLWWFLKRLTA